MEKENLDIDSEFEKLKEDERKVETEVGKIEEKIIFYKNFAWSLVVFGFIAGIVGILEHFFGGDMKLYEIGDFTGGIVASTWSLAGLFIIYVAFLGQKQQILQQKLEIKYNNYEVKATRKELEAQKLQMMEQNRNLFQQRFENTFFQMLNLHHQIVNNIDIRNEKGRDCFKLLYNLLYDRMRTNVSNVTRPNTNIDTTIDTFLSLYKGYQSDFSHYFRNLYRIIKFIHASTSIDKQSYADILRAQLSTYELLLLFYNCLSPFGMEKMKPFVEEYQLLKNISDNLLIDLDHKKIFSSNAFGGN